MQRLAVAGLEPGTSPFAAAGTPSEAALHKLFIDGVLVAGPLAARECMTWIELRGMVAPAIADAELEAAATTAGARIVPAAAPGGIVVGIVRRLVENETGLDPNRIGTLMDVFDAAVQ